MRRGRVGGFRRAGLLGKDLGGVWREGLEGLCWLRSPPSGTFQGWFTLGMLGSWSCLGYAKGFPWGTTVP